MNRNKPTDRELMTEGNNKRKNILKPGKTAGRANNTNRFDSLYTGLILGIILPILAIIAIWIFNSEGSLVNYLKGFYRVNSLAGLISLSAIPNLLLFFIFIWTNRIKSARGVIFATFIAAFIMLLFKVL